MKASATSSADTSACSRSSVEAVCRLRPPLAPSIVQQAAHSMGGNARLATGLDDCGVGFLVSVPNTDFRAG